MTQKRLSAAFANRAPRMRPDAPFDIDAEVARAYEEFPELKGNTYFIDVAADRVVHPNLTDAMSDRFLDDWGVRKAMQGVRREKRSAFYSKEPFRFPANVVLLYLEKDSGTLGVSPGGYALGQRQRAVFDHELGHALTLRTPCMEKAFGDRLIRETMAENFMLFRQFGRYGRSRRIQAEERVVRSATDFIFGSKEHENYFAAPAMEKILGLGKVFNLAALPPRETVRLSREMAQQYMPGPQAVRRLKRELAPSNDEGRFAGLAKRTLETPMEEAFKWGSRVLRYKMGEGYNSWEGDASGFRNNLWPHIRKELDKREKQFRLTPSVRRALSDPPPAPQTGPENCPRRTPRCPCAE